MNISSDDSSFNTNRRYSDAHALMFSSVNDHSRQPEFDDDCDDDDDDDDDDGVAAGGVDDGDDSGAALDAVMLAVDVSEGR